MLPPTFAPGSSVTASTRATDRPASTPKSSRRQPPRRPFDSLTPAYRRRLERGGIKRSAYESGAQLSAARGHAATPERPARADNKVTYLAYRAHRDQAMRVLTTNGVQTISGMTAAERSVVGRHLNAVRWYLNHGRTNSILPTFKGKYVTGYTSADNFAAPVTVKLETGYAAVESLQRSGQLDFLSIYPDAA